MTEEYDGLTAVELFAGVGGFALGLEGRLRGFHPNQRGWSWDRGRGPWRVIWSNQWEPSTKRQHAADCYREMFPDTPLVDADISAVLDYSFRDESEALVRHAFESHTSARLSDAERERLASEIAERWAQHPLPEEFDLLVGGFPCQDYSVAKPLTQASGIVGEKGVLWWEIERIIRHRRPTHVLLENVDRLLKSPSSARGRDFAIMLSCFAFHGYEVEWRVINAAHYGFPQRRRRVFVYARHADPADAPHSDDFESFARHLLADEGVIAKAFPCQLERPTVRTELLDADGDLLEPHELTAGWPKRASSLWATAGYMRSGRVLTSSVSGPSDDDPLPLAGGPFTLGQMLLPVTDVLKDESLHDLLIDREELGRASSMDHEDDLASGVVGTWRYLKGAKSVPRGKYHYQEGAVAFPEPLDQAARTVLTGEGGASPSRFKLVVHQDVPEHLTSHEWPAAVRHALIGTDEGIHVYRRLAPQELERLNMFEDDWTASIGSPGRRAFCMGNALVVGIVQRLGREIASRALS